MNIKDIKNVIIEAIKNENNYKAILIDGAWGCGKTTAVKDAIKELSIDTLSKKKIVYQSLFGIKDVSELAACFSYTGKIIYSLAKSIASPFTKLIPIVGEQINESIENSTALFARGPSKRKDTVFIFDDLERTDEHLSYIALLGFFNQLIMRGCRIICVSSLNDLSIMDVERKNGLDAFLEKAFDRIFYINECPEEIIFSIFSDNEKAKQCINQCVDMFTSNIRLALKAHRLLADIYNKAEEHKYDLYRKFNDFQIMKAVICATKAIYYFKTIENNDDEKKMNDSFYDFLTIAGSKQLDIRIIKNINEVMKKDSSYYLPEEIEDIKSLAKCICMVDVHKDFDMLIKSYPLDLKIKQKNIYDVSVFYFDDKGKQDYFLKFKQDTLAGKLAINKTYIDRFVELIKYTDSNLTEDGLLDYIIKRIIKNYSNGDKEAYNRLEDYIHFPDESNNQRIVVDTFNSISLQLNKAEADYLELEMNKSYKTKDFTYLVNLLYDVEHYNKPERVRINVKQLLLKNYFYLPDLSSTLEYESWSYCHQVAKLSRNDNNLSSAFLKVLKDETKKHKDSKSAIDRAKALVQYNYGSDELEDFMSFCKEL